MINYFLFRGQWYAYVFDTLKMIEINSSSNKIDPMKWIQFKIATIKKAN